jgi:predicted nuclease of predicted toxin-antitoxin system
MRILIDECLDWRLCRYLPDHACSTVQQMGWSGESNGTLLSLAEAYFEVFVTGDRNLSFQQNLSGRKIAVIVWKLTAPN